METELFPCLVDMRFLGVRVDTEASSLTKETISCKRTSSIISSKKRNRNRTSDMGSKIDCQSF